MKNRKMFFLDKIFIFFNSVLDDIHEFVTTLCNTWGVAAPDFGTFSIFVSIFCFTF